ncbi:hypothetical protein ACLOJK_006624 [Asimina triloba]
MLVGSPVLDRGSTMSAGPAVFSMGVAYASRFPDNHDGDEAFYRRRVPHEPHEEKLSQDDKGVIVWVTNINCVVIHESKWDALFTFLVYWDVVVEDFSGIAALLDHGASSLCGPIMYGVYSFERLRLGVLGGRPLNVWQGIIIAPLYLSSLQEELLTRGGKRGVAREAPLRWLAILLGAQSFHLWGLRSPRRFDTGSPRSSGGCLSRGLWSRCRIIGDPLDCFGMG